jgi:hypothetical protein
LVSTSAHVPAGPAVQRLVQVQLQSRPSGATVSENGVRLGVTPYEMSAPAGSEHIIQFTLPGHHPQTQSFRADVDTTQAAVMERIDVARPASPPPTERPHHRSARRKAPAGDRDLDSRARTINPFAR